MIETSKIAPSEEELNKGDDEFTYESDFFEQDCGYLSSEGEERDS